MLRCISQFVFILKIKVCLQVLLCITFSLNNLGILFIQGIKNQEKLRAQPGDEERNSDSLKDGDFYNERDVTAAECVRYIVSAVRNYCVSHRIGWGLEFLILRVPCYQWRTVKCFPFEI